MGGYVPYIIVAVGNHHRAKYSRMNPNEHKQGTWGDILKYMGERKRGTNLHHRARLSMPRIRSQNVFSDVTDILTLILSDSGILYYFDKYRNS
jgi:hypothetical protein